MKNFQFAETIVTAARKNFWSGCVLMAVAVVGGCELKTYEFFTPDTHGTVTPTLLDIDPPTFTNPGPRLSLSGPFSINSFQYDVNDVVGSNGVAASGVDWNTVTAMRASNGLSLPITHSGSQATGSLNGIADGQIGINWSASDIRGNKSTISQSFFLKNTGPVIGFTTTPLTTFSSNAVSTPFTLGGTITDAYLNSAVGTISKPGVDNLCGTADDVLWPVGTGGGQVSANSFSYTSSALSSGSFSLGYTAYNGVPFGGTSATVRYCILVRADDKATDATGTSKPNVTTKLFESSLTWQPMLPVVGSVTGAVTINGSAATGITVTSNGQTVSLNGGMYTINNLPAGSQTLTLGAIPAGVSCPTSPQNITIIAGLPITVNFACTQPLPGSITGSVTVNGTPTTGFTVTASGQTVTVTAATYTINNVTAGTVIVTLGAIPAGVTCTVVSLTVIVPVNAPVTANFTCSQPLPFTIIVTATYRHIVVNVNSEVCLAISTSPAQPNAAYQVQFSGPGGNGQSSGVLSTSGTAVARIPITAFGLWAGVVTSGTQSTSWSKDVSSAPGTCTAP